MESINRKVLVISIIISLLIGFGGGFGFEKIYKPVGIGTELTNRESGAPNGVDFGLFWEVYNGLVAKYVDPTKLDRQKMLYGAISGMVNSVGDPYTVYFEPSTSKKFQEEISGAFGGVGMEIGKKNNVLTVITPIKDSPAFKAGIQPGDRILKVDSKPTANLSVEEAVNLIRGTNGTKVTITISPADSNTTRVVELVRAPIKIPAADWKMIDGHIAYIEIYEFNENVDSQFKSAVQDILKSKADRIVLDVRNNPGGLLDSAVNIAGWFLDKNSTVTIEDFGNGIKNNYTTDGNAAIKSLPTVVIMNGGSASASEILAGALHDDRGIKLIGDKSFGKGSVQELQKYFDGSSLKVTIANWLTPSGISISKKGLDPDVPATLDEKELAAGHYEFGTPGKDPQLDKAIEIVNNLH